MLINVSPVRRFSFHGSDLVPALEMKDRLHTYNYYIYIYHLLIPTPFFDKDIYAK
jgi:hypothetical protein